ncbi:MAG TPA: dephospho-CoA kinase [Bacteroidia bacterium]|nr:dephospho-CoA kinase [Bacteroidia bacterium]
MLKIGITGGIGSGKSTVSKIFSQLGIPVFYSDKEARDLLYSDKSVITAIENIFGKNIFDSYGLIDRKKIAEIVFKDAKKLAQLNAIIHPAVAEKFEKWGAEKKDVPYILKEAAILFESGSHKGLDKIITVTAPPELRIQRVIKRDNISREMVEDRIQKQWTDEAKINLSDFVIVNDETKMILPQILEIHKQLTAIA